MPVRAEKVPAALPCAYVISFPASMPMESSAASSDAIHAKPSHRDAGDNNVNGEKKGQSTQTVDFAKFTMFRVNVTNVLSVETPEPEA